MYSELDTVVFMGDYNAKAHVSSQNGRDLCILKFLADTNFVAIDTLSFCTGANYSFVSYDGKYETLIDHICIPVEKLYCATSCTILYDHCLKSNH